MWCIVEGGYVWFDIGAEFLGAVSHVEGHGLDGGVVGEVIVGGGAVGVDYLGERGESDEEEKEEGGGLLRAVAGVVLCHRDSSSLVAVYCIIVVVLPWLCRCSIMGCKKYLVCRCSYF